MFDVDMAFVNRPLPSSATHDIHCPLMGTAGLNYYRTSCLERQKARTCNRKQCPEWRQIEKPPAPKVVLPPKEATPKPKPRCSVAGCAELPRVKGFCRQHYDETRKEVRVEKQRERIQTKGKMITKKACNECGRQMRIMARGLCGGCWSALKRRGELDAKHPAKKRGENPPPKAAAKSQPQPETVVAAKDLPPVWQQVTLTFTERDQDLFSALKDWAEEERRTLHQQVLLILDRANATNLRERGL